MNVAGITVWMIFVAFTATVVTVSTPVNALSCYNCTTTNRTDACAVNGTDVDIMTCLPGQTTCTVEEEKGIGINSDHYNLTRGCADKCIYEGCGVWGTDHKDYILCRTCCTEDICNIGSDALNVAHDAILILTSGISGIFLIIRTSVT